MGDMDKPGSYPFCPLCARRLESRGRFSEVLWWCTYCLRWIKPPPADDRHREAMRLACYLSEDGE